MVGIFIITLSGTISYYVNTSYAAWNSVSYSEESFEFSVSVPTHIEISEPPTKIEYKEKETFDQTGMVVKQVYSSGRKVIIEDFDISPSGELTTNDTVITISYNGFTTTQNITVIKPNLDTSGANQPELLTNMIPVYYDETCNNNEGCWEKADNTNGSETYKWYDYNQKMWANAVTVSSTNRSTYLSAEEGTEIPMDEINSMWVWIPRYTYTYFISSEPTEIKIQFEQGTQSNGTITCTDNVSASGYTSETCTDKNTTSLVPGTSAYTHPAFNFGDTSLTGFWIGKYENTANQTFSRVSESTSEDSITIKSNLAPLVYKSLSYFFRDIRQMEKANNMYGFEQSSSTTFNLDGTLTGDTNNIDTHMLKNTEWGAVVYLSHSKYGINSEIPINNSNFPLITGYRSSATGNVYGVYDMSGGQWEYVMGNMVNSSNQFYTSGARQWSTTIMPLAKYYDSYKYDSSNDDSYSRGKLGDATKEMSPSSRTWYQDYAGFVYSTSPWFIRGGKNDRDESVGAFSFSSSSGNAGTNYSSRSALVVLNSN